MYEAYFGLVERPFSIAPDPQYLYMSRRHKEAMAHLSYGLSQGGCFIVLTGEVGTGKTTLCRNLLTNLPDNVDIALILNANINEQELLQTICDELGIIYPEKTSQKALLDLINQHLLDTFAANRHTVLIIDEAQILSRDVLEQIRLLTNLETNKAKLLQIILIGQPELNQLLMRNDLRQLAQRVTARYHLGALARNEMEDYVNYRLGVAGCKRPIFTKQALNKVHALTSGIPRKINVLADHALLSAYSSSQNTIDAKIVKKAAKDVFIEETQGISFNLPKWGWLSAFGAVILFLNIGLWWWFADAQNALNTKAQEPVVQSPTKTTTTTDTQKTDLVTASGVTNEEEREPKAEEKPSPSSEEQNSEEVTVVGSEQNVVENEVVLNQGLVSDDIETEVGSVQFLDQEIKLTKEELLTAESPQSDDSIENSGELARLLETAADQTGRFYSFRRLATIWSSELPEKVLRPVCEVIQTQDLACLPLYRWQQLIRYNRPAILILKHNDQLHRVVVTSIVGNVASLYIGSRVRQVSLTEVRRLWTKKGMIFWRPTEIGNPFYQPGDRSSDIVWLRWYLGRALSVVNLPALQSTTNSLFDLDMSQKLFALQNGFKIETDSKVGDETYLLMNELINPEKTPVLFKRSL